MNDIDRKRIAAASDRLAVVEKTRNLRRAEFEIATAALISIEREHVLVIEKLNSLKRGVAL